MKIKLGFVTNSSSMCYILDKRTLTDEELKLIRENSFLRKPISHGASRCSAYGEEEEVSSFYHFLRANDAEWVAKGYDGWENPLTEWLQDHLAQIGVDNIIFVRRSDEQMGGRVKNRDVIMEKAIARKEYH